MPIISKKMESAYYIANDKIFWRLLFADPHGANFICGCARHFKSLIIIKRTDLYEIYI